MQDQSSRPTAVPWKEYMFYAIWISDHLARLEITTNLLIGAYLNPSRLIASLCYKNRCYTQNFVRVNGCCWWMLFVCLWLVCYRVWSILVQKIVPWLILSQIATYDPFSGCYHFGMLFNFFKTSILQTLLAIFQFDTIASLYTSFTPVCSKNMANLVSHSLCHKL
jgi:hypothetical protein